MCDYSLHHVNSRPAKIGDRLTTRNFGLGTRGFAASEDANLRSAFCRGRSCRFTASLSETDAPEKQ